MPRVDFENTQINRALTLPARQEDARQADAAPPTVRERLLGLLVVWQLVFIVGSNMLDFFPHRPLSRDELSDFREAKAETLPKLSVVPYLAGVTDRWAQLTGQYQMWWLFAPNFPPQATFPAVEFRWDDAARTEFTALNGNRSNDESNLGKSPCHAPVRLRSSLDPADAGSYCRWPCSTDRLFQYEVHLGLGLVYWNPAWAAEDEAGWREVFRAVVARQWKSYRAYLRWRLQQYIAEHPGQPLPKQVVLSMRIYHTAPVGSLSREPTGMHEQIVARWFPAADDDANSAYLPVEAFDPFANRFLRLPRDGETGAVCSRMESNPVAIHAISGAGDSP
jgi:hypothetical protein